MCPSPRQLLLLALAALPSTSLAQVPKDELPGPTCVFPVAPDGAAASVAGPTLPGPTRLAPALPRPGRAARPLSSVAPTGSARNLVIALRFADHGPAGQNRTLPSRSDLDTIWNAPGGHPTLAPTGSVRDVWLENSYGVFTFDSTVVAWFDLPGTEAYYANGSYGLSTLTWDLVTDGLALVDPLVDFTDFDQDGDGRVDVLTVLHSGYGAEFSGLDQYGTPSVDRIWSHRWTVDPPWVSAEGVTAADYSISPGLWGTAGSDPVRLGVLAHELGHILGLPDLYDVGGTSYGAGNWDLMAHGAWGFDATQLHPSHLSAWSKWKLGWVEPQGILPGTYSLQPVELAPDVALVDCGFGPGEYLLLENRQPVGLDAMLPGKGLAIWHVDERKGSWTGNAVNVDEGWPGMPVLPLWPSNDLHFRLALLAPDDLWELERLGDRGDDGDLWPLGSIDALDDFTSPGLFAYQGGTKIEAGNDLNDIHLVGSDLVFTYLNAQRPLITTVSLPPATQGVPYAFQLTGAGGIGPWVWSEWLDDPSYAHAVQPTSSFLSAGVAQGWHADDAVWYLQLPFAFPYWETALTRIAVSSNGFVDLVPVEEADYSSDDGSLFAHRRIAPLWHDLTTTMAGDDVFVDLSVGGQVTVRWQAHTYSSGLPCNFSVTLFEDGRVRFDYGSGNVLDGPAVVGLGRGHGGDCVLVPGYNDESTLTNALSVLFARQGSQLPPGLRVNGDGWIAGTPLLSGSFEATFDYVDEIYNCDRQTLGLTVAPATGQRRAPAPSRRP